MLPKHDEKELFGHSRAHLSRMRLGVTGHPGIPGKLNDIDARALGQAQPLIGYISGAWLGLE